MPHQKRLSEQTIVITGASSGIGLATARAASAAGARVVLAARDGEALSRIAEELNSAGGDALAVVTDVGEEAEVEALSSEAIARFGGYDTWVNNAGVGVISTVEKTSSEDHQRIFKTNYFGLVYGSLAAVRHFRGRASASALINLGSAVSEMPMALSVAYSASKHAIKGFTDGLRVELMQESLPISVTLIKPSGIDTPFFDHAKTNMGGMGKAPGTVYAPSVVASAILHAAEHGGRDIAVGQTSAFGGRIAALVPRVIDGVQSLMTYEDLIDYGHMPEGENLHEAPEEGRERSRFGSGRSFSLTTEAQMHPVLSGAAFMAAGALAFAAITAMRSVR